MSTIPSNTPENISNAEAVSVSAVSAGGTDSLQESTAVSTAKVLDFSSRLLARRAAEIPAPIIKKLPIVNSSDELSELVTKELPGFMDQVFSKAENLNEIDPETISNFQAMMHMAAEIDAKAGRFGMSGADNYTSFSDTFKRALRPALRNLVPENEPLLRDINVNLSAIFNNTIQDKLLTAYGEIIKNKDTYETPERFEKRLEALKSLKRSWKVGGLDWAISNEHSDQKSKGGRNPFMVTGGSIPQRFENILTFVLETFVEHYVERVWETEAALRHAPAELAKSA